MRYFFAIAIWKKIHAIHFFISCITSHQHCSVPSSTLLQPTSNSQPFQHVDISFTQNNQEPIATSQQTAEERLLASLLNYGKQKEATKIVQPKVVQSHIIQRQNVPPTVQPPTFQPPSFPVDFTNLEVQQAFETPNHNQLNPNIITRPRPNTASFVDNMQISTGLNSAIEASQGKPLTPTPLMMKSGRSDTITSTNSQGVRYDFPNSDSGSQESNAVSKTITKTSPQAAALAQVINGKIASNSSISTVSQFTTAGSIQPPIQAPILQPNKTQSLID